MVKIIPQKGLAWKPLSLKSKVLSHSLDLDGLIGVEELTDYSLDKKNNVIGAPKESKPTLKTKDGGVKKKRKRNRTKKGKDKLKLEEIEDDEEEQEDAEENIMEESNELPAAIPAKKKLKRKKNNKFLVEENIDNNTTYEDDLESEHLDSNEPHCKKLKQKKKNKKQTYLSIKSEHIPCLSANNEEFFVEMSEWLKLNIPESVVKALYEKGFKTPTKIQSLVLPSALLARKDIVGAAETGSGKTLAFGIPILAGIINRIENPTEEEDNNSELEEEIDDEESANKTEFVERKRNKLYALILTPTRELAIQVQNHILDAAKYTPVKVACVVGGLSTEKQIRILNQSPHILVATPGRLWEFIQLGHFHLTDLYKLNYLVIDETDRMIESGHFPELKNILDRVTMTETSQPRQTFVFSATLTHSLKNSLNLKKGQTKSKKLPKGDPSIRKLQDLLKIKSPKIVDITEKMGLTKTLTESKIFCKYDEKDSYLYYFILQHPGRTLVFCNSISSVKRMTQLLTMLKCAPLPLHASMNQRQRLKNLDKFRTQNNSILLATDVAARGLDIPGIEHVIHYHVPRTSEIYIHRSGRTARANKEGLTLILVEQDEISLYIKMFNSLEKKIDLPDFPIDESFHSLATKRIELAKNIDHLENKLKKNRPDNWLEKAAKDMDIIVDDENLIQTKESSREEKLISKALSAHRRELQTLLSKNIQSSQCQVSTQSALNAVKQCVEDVKAEKKMALKKRNKHKRKFKKKKTSAAPTS
uniref:ATP-dependent RNA helicase n=1 Tax=Cacopsylla melanoneura TaxID=428564 RepID=A0A8D8R1W5_9HEMI